MPRNLTALRRALRDAAAIKAHLHVAQSAKDWPPGDIIGRTAGGWLVYDDGETRRVLFADWLKT